jgi:PBSX family phage terminase large subunit
MATFRKEWFNPLYFVINNTLKENPRINKVFVYGSKSSAKTFTLAQYIEKEVALKKTDAICFRKESTRIKTTLKKSFQKAIKQTRLSNVFNVQDFQINSVHGNSIVFKGLDSEDKVKGIEDFGYLLFDELDHFTLEDYEQADMSFRGEVAKVFFLTWNPISDKLWIKPYLDQFTWLDAKYQLPSPQSFVKISECGTMLYIKTLYTDNYWTVGSPCGAYGYYDEKLIDKYNQMKVTNYKSWLVNVNAEWGIAENKNPYFYAFDQDKHVSKVPLIYNRQLPLYLSFDFNIDPATCVVSQFVEGGFLNVIKSYKVNNCPLKELLTRIKSDYHGAVFLVTSDPAGGARNAGYDSINTTMHNIIRTELNLGLSQMSKPLLNYTKSTAHTELRIFVNNILQNHPRINICGVNCKELIHDMQIAQTMDGSDKLYKTSGNTEFGMHLVDCFVYLLATYFNNFAKRKL